jgi:hypothetical protein
VAAGTPGLRRDGNGRSKDDWNRAVEVLDSDEEMDGSPGFGKSQWTAHWAALC